MLDFKKLNNKVALRGKIINSVRQKYDTVSKEQIVYFVLGVNRKDYPLTYNKEKMNFFYCYISERLMSGAFLDIFRKEIDTYDDVVIYGIIDNIPYRELKDIRVNYRATNCYVSSICIIDYKKMKDADKISNDEKLIINAVRKTFGTDINVQLDESAFKKDYNGLENDNLPDF